MTLAYMTKEQQVKEKREGRNRRNIALMHLG